MEVAAVTAPAAGLRKWLAIGTGVAIEIGESVLRAVAVRVRPGGAKVLGSATIERFRERPATDWGAEYAGWARRTGVGRTPVTVVAPRREVIVRQLMLPGVQERDLAAAISYQIDGLHPYPEDTAVWTWARLGASGAVLVGLIRQEVVDEISNLFAEAGIPLAGITFSAAALYSAIRIASRPAPQFLALREVDGAVEAYGESPSRALLSGLFEDDPERSSRLAAAELRLAADAPVVALEELLSAAARPEEFDAASNAVALAAAIANACPRLALPANLLPAEKRVQSSRLIYVPTVALAVALLVAALLLAGQSSWQDRKYLEKLQAEIARLEKQAAQAAEIDRATASARERIALLDRHRARPRADADSLKELTSLLAPPAWLMSLQMTRTDVTLAGEAEQAAPLLKVIDESPLFRDSSFSQAMTKIGGGGESFIIRARREGAGTGLEPGEQR